PARSTLLLSSAASDVYKRQDISSGDDLVKLGDHPQNPSWSLGVLGMPGFTAYMGLLDIGQPKEGETLVVAAATGPAVSYTHLTLPTRV
ncbi:hypothetical protein KQJ25_39720, partial [Escherichia sp. S69_ASV_4]|nr:hypothetical protein [Escherichia sp. S69_ASV_4]